MTPLHSPAASTPTTPAREWWRHSVIYQVYPRSFASSGGPIGDLPGITARLPHLTHLGVDALWLSPFYTSPQNDGGYDVADYRDIDPLFGTLQDAEAMIEIAHELGLKVIVDLVPNHTSDQHAWFQRALEAGPGSPERDRYWFRTSDQIPTNWRSIFGGPAWTRVCDREDAPGSPWEHDQQWYLNLFDSSQPDLNWNNPEVREEFHAILRFWLDRGVDGFRVDVAHGLVKDPALPDWDGEIHMVEGDASTSPTEDAPAAARAPMFDQEGVHEIYREWNAILATYPGDRALVAEAWVEPEERLARYVRLGEMHQAFNFGFLASEWDASQLREVIETSYAANDAVGAPTTWVMSNHDVIRHASRLGMSYTGKKQNGIGAEDPQPDAALGLRRARAATLLTLGLAGSVYLYQGEELGLPEHSTLPDELREDPAFFRTHGAEKGRDGCRVPLPWEAASPGFGFSPDGATWLPQPPTWAELAVDAQSGDPDSTLEFYREALALRREWDLGIAELTWADEPAGDDAIAFVSRHPAGGRPDVLVLTAFDAALPIPEGWEVRIASSAVGNGEIGPDVTAWLTR
ncbi:MAG: glycoside hydrolase family 13 protein [bacterium]|nr:glycoside hydrolase family 13 protein [bacterium]